MPVITKILQQQGVKQDRVHVYIDEQFCTSVRERTWIGMNLGIGSKISCDKLKLLEQNFWKKLYGVRSWEREKIRISRIIQWFSLHISQVDIVTIGLGANSNDYLESIHSEEKGEPDLSIRLPNSNIEIIALEVSGTEKMQGIDYWVRKDKVEYIQNHKERDIWIVLHYQLPKEKFVWLKISNNKSYLTEVINVKGADEHYVVFTNEDEEVKQSSYFKDYILAKLDKI